MRSCVGWRHAERAVVAGRSRNTPGLKRLHDVPHQKVGPHVTCSQPASPIWTMGHALRTYKQVSETRVVMRSFAETSSDQRVQIERELAAPCTKQRGKSKCIVSF